MAKSGRRLWALALAPLLLAPHVLRAQQEPPVPGIQWVKEHYRKYEYEIPMRDGAKLHTAVYVPVDSSQKYPILLNRTPYSVRPYGDTIYPASLGPNSRFAREGYIFAHQDVRGRYLSEGEFSDMRAQLPNKKSKRDVDESSDTYDTIEWLLEHVKGNNGRVGQYGISYPGFYTSAGLVNAHPALKASSPQAPIADWWYDDFHHWGTLFLPHAYGFLPFFSIARPSPVQQYTMVTPRPQTPDGYKFFLELGGLSNANERYLQHKIMFWDSLVAHPNYDSFWQARNLLPHLKNIKPAVLTVGGWFDAEDLYGALNTYSTIEQNNPAQYNGIVMGPWVHGGWSRTMGDALGNMRFMQATGLFYRDSIELPFFNYYLKGKGAATLPEAYMFETGANRWRRFDSWPPREATAQWLTLLGGSHVGMSGEAGSGFDEFVSDPAHPVPYTQDIAIGMTQQYMTDDQRFATRRADVLSYRTDELKESLTLAGPLEVELWVSTTQQDADWVVKLVDIFPDSARDFQGLPPGMHTAGYEMMVRSEAIRGRFRDDPSAPKPFVPGQPTLVKFRLQDVMHTFMPGHRMMIQVQSTWFPLIDRNPQKWVDNIFLATDADFATATHRVYHDAEHPTRVQIWVLR